MIGFAHRGAPSAGVRENSLEAFTAALSTGVTALESDVWLTADDVPVLVHDGVLRKGLRRHAIRSLRAADLPGWLPSLAALYERTGGDFDLSLDVKDADAGLPVIDVADKYGVADKLWLCSSTDQVRAWRSAARDAHLVVSTSLKPKRQTGLVEQAGDADSRIDRAAEAGAHAFNLRALEWTAARVRRCHDQNLLAFAWDVQRIRLLDELREYGCDAIYSDSVGLLSRL